MVSSSVHFLINVLIPFSFRTTYFFFVSMYHILFICSSARGHLGWLCVMVSMDRGAGIPVEGWLRTLRYIPSSAGSPCRAGDSGFHWQIDKIVFSMNELVIYLSQNYWETESCCLRLNMSPPHAVIWPNWSHPEDLRRPKLISQILPNGCFTEDLPPPTARVLKNKKLSLSN